MAAGVSAGAAQRVTKPELVEMVSEAAQRGADVSTAERPELDLRVVLLTVSDGGLLVALPGADTGRGLPRGFAQPSEPLDSAARRIVRDATGVQDQYLEQLYTLSVREPPPWTVIISYMGLVCSAQGEAAPNAGLWHNAAQPPPLSPADRMVLEYALVRLRAKLGYTNLAIFLLPPVFTLTELQSAYETILGRLLDKRNFRRRVIASGMVAATEGTRRIGSHRPAALYRFQPGHDPETYLTPPWAEGV